jgi:hypothetical protein
MKLQLDGVNIHDLAKCMLSDGFVGQGMQNPETSEDYILLAADDPDVDSKLPEARRSFWQRAYYHYKVFLARKRFGRLSTLSNNGG